MTINRLQLIEQKEWGESDISRVLLFWLQRSQNGNHLSGTVVAKRLKRTDKSRRTCLCVELVKDQPWFRQPCFQPGFTEPTPLDAAGALLPHLCTLTLKG